MFLHCIDWLYIIYYILSPNQKWISLKLHRCRWTIAKCAWPIWSLRNGGHLSIHIDRIKEVSVPKETIYLFFYQRFPLLFYSMCSKSIWTILRYVKKVSVLWFHNREVYPVSSFILRRGVSVQLSTKLPRFDLWPDNRDLLWMPERTQRTAMWTKKNNRCQHRLNSYV